VPVSSGLTVPAAVGRCDGDLAVAETVVLFRDWPPDDTDTPQTPKAVSVVQGGAKDQPLRQVRPAISGRPRSAVLKGSYEILGEYDLGVGSA
jgi:hypothetical protein